jgi:Zn-dependent M28 family amino/carboxypeptidase
MNNNAPYRFKVQQYFLSALLLLSIFASAFAQTGATAAKGTLSPDEKIFSDEVNVATIKAITATLSAPDMQGRGTMQPDGDKAADYLAKYMQTLGLKPLGDSGSFLQKIKFKETAVGPETSVKIGDDALKIGTDYYMLPVSSNDNIAGGDVVFVGYGLVSDALKRNDMAGVDLKGKIVMVLGGVPANLQNDPVAKTKNTFAMIRSLLQSGAAGIILLKNGRERSGFAETAKYLTRRSVTMEDGQPRPPQALPPCLALSDAATEKLFAGSGMSYKDAKTAADSNDFKPITLKQTININVKYRTNSGIGSNVVGVMEGSDPKLKSEAVVFSAHYDAFGVENGKTYPGAADNALGVAEMLSVAEAFSKHKVKPKRSLIFLAVTGEEYGLYGSRYWAKNPTWDITKVAADLNLDGIGTEVYGPVKTFVGYGAEYSSLGPVMDDIARVMDINVIPDPIPQEQAFYRSDHYSFVERGVPSLVLMGAPGGEKEAWIKRMGEFEQADYHEPGDIIRPNWDWEGARTVAVVMGIMGVRISATEKMPEWLPGSKFVKMERGYSGPVPQ